MDDTQHPTPPESTATQQPSAALPISQDPRYTEVNQIRERFGLAKSSFYNRLRHLRITTWKEGPKSFLDLDQVAMFELFHEHIARTRTFDGFPIPEPTGPQDATLEEESEALATTEHQGIEASTQAINTNAPLSVAEVVAARAQMNAVKLLAAEELATEFLVENPDKLPAHLQNELNQVVTASRNRQVEVLGKYSTDDFANEVMSVLLSV
jgi:hypothetical protein